MNNNKRSQVSSFNTSNLNEVKDLVNAAILCVDSAIGQRLTYPEGFCDLFIAGAEWQQHQNDALLSDMENTLKKIFELTDCNNSKEGQAICTIADYVEQIFIKYGIPKD